MKWDGTKMRWLVYNSSIDTCFPSQVALHPNVILFYNLPFYYLLTTCIQVITVNTARIVQDKFFWKKEVVPWIRTKKNMANWMKTAHNSCRKGKLRSKCLPCKAPQWAIVNWCQITYIIFPGSEELLPEALQGKNKLEEAVMQSSPIELSLELSFVGREAPVSLRGTTCEGCETTRIPQGLQGWWAWLS